MRERSEGETIGKEVKDGGKREGSEVKKRKVSGKTGSESGSHW